MEERSGVGFGSCVGEVPGMWGSMGEVWKSVWGECGGCVEVGKVCWDAERCGDVESQHTLLHLSPHSPHSPDTSSHNHPTPLPRTHLTRLSTLPSYLPTPLTPFLHLPQHFPTLITHTSSQPPRLL